MMDSRRGAVIAGQIDPRLRGRRTHLCSVCDFPIAVYGRCAPCFHAYCLTCAAAMSQCIICQAWVTKLERIPLETGLYISPLTLQGFRTEADLAKHAQQMEEQLPAFMLTGGGASGGSMQGYGQQQHQQHQQPGWKPAPPPGVPPAPGSGRQQQQQRQPRHGAGAVMVPR